MEKKQEMFYTPAKLEKKDKYVYNTYFYLYFCLKNTYFRFMNL